MKPKTEELLYVLLWSAEMLTRPTFRNLTEGFESWAYRNGLLRQLGTLERAHFLERDLKRPNEPIYRLTELGRLHALGGRDPEARWSRRWDHVWRLVLFDVPLAQNRQRNRLRQSLRDRGFGCLQGSVWITPDSLQPERQTLAGTQSNPASLVLFEGRPSGNETDHELVAAAWNFEEINAGYARDLSLLDQFPIISLKEHKGRAALQQWARMESTAWLSAVAADPLLPQELLPCSYLGRRTWRKRVETLARAGQQLQEFRM